MALLRLHIPALLVLLAGVCAADDPAAERQRIALERQRVEADFKTQEAACGRRFAVTDCVDDVRSRRRQALAPLREQELLLADAERKRRAAERAQAIEKNRIEADNRAVPPPPIASAVRASPLGPAASGSSGRHLAGAPEGRAERAAARASAAEQRRQDAQADRDRIEKRLQQRAAEGKHPSPLPVPEAKP